MLIENGFPRGVLRAPASKSHAQRLLILSYVSGEKTRVICPDLSNDIVKTAEGLCALGASLLWRGDGFLFSPGSAPKEAEIDVGESGAALRFLLPLCASLGVKADFTMSGRLPERPIAPLLAVLRAGGARAEQKGRVLSLSGRFSGGRFPLQGGLSSQFLSGLLMASPLAEQPSQFTVSGPSVSRGYVQMTLQAMRLFGVSPLVSGNVYTVPENKKYRSPGLVRCEGDWSSVSVFLSAAAKGGRLQVTGLNPLSSQPDKRILDMLISAGARPEWRENALLVQKSPLRPFTFDVDACPDLAPAAAVLMAAAKGKSVMTGTGRLIHKESDRAEGVARALRAVGVGAENEGDRIVVTGRGETDGGHVETFSDHRLAIMAAGLAAMAKNPVIIDDCECCAKSYPRFFDDWNRLRGRNEVLQPE